MKFNRGKKREKTHFMMAAVVHGILIGVAGVLLFFFILNAAEKRTIAEEKELPKSSALQKVKNTSSESKFYAMQYGVYSSEQAANDFLAGHPELVNVAIVPAGKQYYLWGGIDHREKNIKKIVNKDSFIKPFALSGASCDEQGLKMLPQMLRADNLSKLNFNSSKKTTVLPMNWNTNVKAVTKGSKELESVKLQLLAHYAAQNDCLNIKF